MDVEDSEINNIINMINSIRINIGTNISKDAKRVTRTIAPEFSRLGALLEEMKGLLKVKRSAAKAHAKEGE